MNDAMRAETVEITGDGGDADRGLSGPTCRQATRPEGWWSSTTCRATTRPPRRSPGGLPPRATWPSARTSISARLPGASPEDAAAAARAQGGVPDPRLVGDVGGAAAYLRSLPQSNGKVATIGYCSGGRQSFLAACSLDLDAAIDCYGAFVIAPPPEGLGLKIEPIVDRAKDLSCPLLGLFGAEDQHPSPAEVAELEAGAHRPRQGVRVPHL